MRDGVGKGMTTDDGKNARGTRWNVGTLERWNVGTLERWNVRLANPCGERRTCSPVNRPTRQSIAFVKELVHSIAYGTMTTDDGPQFFVVRCPSSVVIFFQGSILKGQS